MAKQATVKKGDIPSGWSCEAADFVNKVSVFSPLAIVFAKETCK